jgi:large subunit ribosomal protein L14
MIQMQTILDVADNSGAKTVRCIRVLGGTKRRTAGLGDIVVVSVQKAIPGAPELVRAGKVTRGVIVRCKQPTRRADGSYVRFDRNAIVLVDADGTTPRGTRVFGAVARELRDRTRPFMKIVSLASEVV